MLKTRIPMMCVAICFVCAMAAGQDDETLVDDKKQDSQREFSIELYKTIMTKTFEQAELTDDQQDKVQSVIDVVIPQLVTKQEEFKVLLTDDQRKMYQAAIRLAEKAKYDKDQQHDYAMKKLKLTEEEVNKYDQLKAGIAALDKKLNDDIGALLTDEQKSRLSMFRPAQPKTSVFQVKLPNMKTTEDAALIWQKLMKVKGAAEFHPDVEKQTAKLKLPIGTDLKKELEALEADGVELLKGFEIMPMENTSALKKPQVKPAVQVQPAGDAPAAGRQPGGRDGG